MSKKIRKKNKTNQTSYEVIASTKVFPLYVTFDAFQEKNKANILKNHLKFCISGTFQAKNFKKLLGGEYQ